MKDERLGGSSFVLNSSAKVQKKVQVIILLPDFAPKLTKKVCVAYWDEYIHF